MSCWIYLTGGTNAAPPRDRTWRERFAGWCGRRLALRHEHVHLEGSARISPESRIDPRQGRIVIGPDSSIAPHAVVQGNVRLGRNCTVQIFSVIVGYGTRDEPTGQITIGDHVRIAPHVMMIAGNHAFDDPDTTIAGQGLHHAPITIENDVWIAGRVTITAGVTIGSGSVIGAGAVVTHDIPPMSIAVGVPARPIKSRRAGADPVDAPGASTDTASR